MHCRFFWGHNNRCANGTCCKPSKKKEQKLPTECVGCPYYQGNGYCFPCMRKLIGKQVVKMFKWLFKKKGCAKHMNNKLEVIGIDHGWSMMKTISQVFVTGVKSIVDKAKEKGRSALYRLSEFLGIKKRLLDIRENVRGAIKTTDKDIAKTALLAKGFREAGQTVANKL